MRADRPRLRLLLAVPGARRAARRGAGRPGERGHARQVATGEDDGPPAGQGFEPASPSDRRPRRWDTDERGIGVGDARSWQSTITTLAELAVAEGWVAEEPELHLLPHLQAAAADGPLALRATRTEDDGTFVVDLDWSGAAEPTRREVRAALFVLVGTIAESVTVIHEIPGAAGREIEVLTGLVGADSPFATHGHTVRLRLTLGSPARDSP